MTNSTQMSHLKITKPIKVPNIMFFHPQWLDQKFKTVSGSVILELRSTERTNLKRLLLQTLNLDRCVTKWGDIVLLLKKAGVTSFSHPKVDEIDF